MVLKRKAKENQIYHMKEQIKLFQEKRKNLSNGLEFYKTVTRVLYRIWIQSMTGAIRSNKNTRIIVGSLNPMNTSKNAQ